MQVVCGPGQAQASSFVEIQKSSLHGAHESLAGHLLTTVEFYVFSDRCVAKGCYAGGV